MRWLVGNYLERFDRKPLSQPENGRVNQARQHDFHRDPLVASRQYRHGNPRNVEAAAVVALGNDKIVKAAENEAHRLLDASVVYAGHFEECRIERFEANDALEAELACEGGR